MSATGCLKGWDTGNRAAVNEIIKFRKSVVEFYSILNKDIKGVKHC